MSIETYEVTDDHREHFSCWVEVYKLSQHFPERMWVVPLMVVLGLGAAAAEMLGVGLAVLLLFAMLGEYDQVSEQGGLLYKAQSVVESVAGSNPGTLVAAFLFFILFNAALIYAYQVVTARVMHHVAQRSRDAVHDTFLSVSYRYMQRYEQGFLVHVLANETWAVSEAFLNVARICVRLCTLVIFGTGLFLLSWVVGLTALAAAILVFFVLLLLARPVRRIGERMLEENQVLAERMLISLYGMRTLRIFAQESYMSRVFNAVSGRVRQLAIREENVKALIGPIGEFGSLAALLIVALVAKRSGVDAASILTAVLMLLRLQPYLREIDAARLELAAKTAALRSVREMMDAGKPMPREGTQKFPGFANALRFENVGFAHEKGRQKALDGATFELRRGETIVLSGPSGSGKTTILNLILRLYDPDSGRITLDGTDFHSFTRASWLSQLAVAGQDVELVEGTLIDNLTIGAQNADPAKVREICDLVEISEDIEALPEGFESRVGSVGKRFSGGQRQRIGLARALMRSPGILILDEAMSALELDREARIFKRITEFMRDGTVLVVSHRAPENYHPDRVIRLEKGVIVQDAVTPMPERLQAQARTTG